jgi:hypothetical protein
MVGQAEWNLHVGAPQRCVFCWSARIGRATLARYGTSQKMPVLAGT